MARSSKPKSLRHKRKRAVRKITEQLTRIGSGRYLRLIRGEADQNLRLAGDFSFPKTRGDCVNVPRPCPYVSCRYNLYLDVQKSGNVTLNFPDLEPGEVAPDASCALDVADGGANTIDAVGEMLNVTRARIGQIEMDFRTRPSIRAALAHLAVDGLPEGSRNMWDDIQADSGGGGEDEFEVEESERTLSATAIRAYGRAISDDGNALRQARQTVEAADRWADAVYAELRVGVALRDAIDRVNATFDV
jgi:hypothetical protein